MTSGNRRDAGRRRLVWGGAGALAFLFLSGGAWLAWTASAARAELSAARAALPGVRDAVMSGDGSGMRRLDVVRRHAVAADEKTHDVVWSVVAGVPLIGSPLDATRGMTTTVRELTERGMPALVSAADSLHPAKLLSVGHLDVISLRRAAPALSTAAATLGRERAAVAALDPSWLGPVADAHGELLAELTALSEASDAASEAARLVPSMLGADGPRRYFLAFQNPAESRASGGLLDAFAIVAADAGRVKVERIGANTQLPPLKAEITDVDDRFAERYADLGATSTWLQANVSPHFPDVAEAWEAMWKGSTGQELDGVLTLDPQALSAVLAGTGPVKAPVVGTVDAGRVEKLVLHEQYAMPALGTDRKSLMLGVGSATIDALLSGKVSPGTLLPGLREVAREGHILVHSRDETEQAHLVDLGLAGAVPDAPGPYAQAVVLNAAGGKLDSWLRTQLDYTVTSCSRSNRSVRIAVTLRNEAPVRGLPSYVTIRSDRPTYPTAPSQNRTELEVLATKGAKLTSATLDGAPMPLAPPTGTLPTSIPDDAATTFLQVAEVRDRPSYWMDLELLPGRTRTLVLTLDEPPGAAEPTLPRQATVIPQIVKAHLRTCPAAR
ncbi:MAG: hypothetical protein QG622_2714 [Actinomycetota bacterium]|nr:hypothetical protein [Actinomycetota bacterium]